MTSSSSWPGLPPTIAQVCEAALRLPCSPSMLPRLIGVLTAPNSTADDIANLIRMDAPLAASTLRLANSAFFSASGGAETIADAVVRLGQRELYRLAALALVSRWESGSAQSEPGDFCRRALCTALAAEALAERTERVDPQMAYTAGLVCDIGNLAVAHVGAAFYPIVRAECAKRGCTWVRAEMDVLGYSHADVGERLLRAWTFPEALAIAAKFCERPAEGPEDSFELLAHLHAAKHIAASFGPGAQDDGFLFELNEAFLLERGFSPDLLTEAMATVHERAKQRLQDKLSHGVIAI